MECLQYPFDANYLLRKKRAIRRELLETAQPLTEKRIAILCGSTTHDIKDILELFLLDNGIRPVFYESEYAQYWQDAMFGNETLDNFHPDLLFIHTTNRNVTQYPSLDGSPEDAERLLQAEYARFETMWETLREKFRCPIIQNNFEPPFYRLLGNQDASSVYGRVNFLTRLNVKFYDYAQSHEQFYIHDINYLAADYGLERWSDPSVWYLYKYALCLSAIPAFAYSLSLIIKSIYGKNKKALALDLDNTLWGGIIGDDGVENIEIGEETAVGEAYREFQSYLKEHKKLGILLNVVSKNEEANALAGLNHPDGILRPEDFIEIKANWEPKSRNLAAIAEELALLTESFVFVDDNPAEREIVRRQIPGAATPELTEVYRYIQSIDRAGYFEVTNLSREDRKRGEMYKENLQRTKQQLAFSDYRDYLLSLEMRAEIRPFEDVHMARIAQLTNKSNQFNLTTRRYTQGEIEAAARSQEYIDLSGRLLDKFGDNGIVSVVLGKIDGEILHIVLWLMSCRVLKRDMEFAMMDQLAACCLERGLKTIKGYYYPTAKNGMVRDFYARQGFSLESEDRQGNTVWHFDVMSDYQNKNTVIQVNSI